MSSEDIHEEIRELNEAIFRLTEKLKNRAFNNREGWQKEHREKCLELRSRLERLTLELEEF